MLLAVRFVFLSVVLCCATQAWAKPIYQFGGEIPWPLSNQRMVTVDHSAGLWRLENREAEKFFNLEMNQGEDGFDWIRISHLDTKTLKVISWGEGTFLRCEADSELETCRSKKTGGSSFSNILLDSQNKDQNDQFGRYIHMYPNGDFTRRPYLVRLVEVKTSLGNVLGVSVVNYVEKDFEHLLGVRVLGEPLACNLAGHWNKSLTCEFSKD